MIYGSSEGNLYIIKKPRILLILGIIGVMNYINTSAGNMQSCQKEISIMESVGMTERQVKKILVWEGIFI